MVSGINAHAIQNPSTIRSNVHRGPDLFGEPGFLKQRHIMTLLAKSDGCGQTSDSGSCDENVEWLSSDCLRSRL
jgi:hypothetical protein